MAGSLSLDLEGEGEGEGGNRSEVESNPRRPRSIELSNSLVE